MMGKKGCLKLMKDENPEMILVHCVIHRENLVAKNSTPVRNEVLRSVMKCIDYIKANAKCEHLFRQFCEKENAGYVRLLLYTKGSCGILEKEKFQMAFLEKAKKQDLVLLSEELGQKVSDKMTIIDLKNIIISSKDYEEEFVRAQLSVISEERVERETEEKKSPFSTQSSSCAGNQN
ncbi:SCAN domain-containing protein 3 [Trichonephila clavipes]|nr:SCAN domain-containing protein 3 [Trichonephila clavipes]